jgi:predicted CXXCH cytochrome family protein
MSASRALAGGLLLVASFLLPACPSASPEEPAAVEADVATSGTLLLAVEDASGAAVVGAHATSWPRGFEATTDAGGLASLALPAGTYRLTVAAAGHATAIVEAVEVRVGETVEVDVTLPLEDDVVAPGLRVALKTAAGRPLAGATVRVGAREAVTSADGEASLSGLPPGELTVEIVPQLVGGAAGWSAALSFEPDAVTLLSLTLSGAPGPGATWSGSAACAECHAEDHDAWAASTHARTWSSDPPADLDPLLDAGLTVDLFRPDRPLPVQVALFRDGGVVRLRLTGSDGDVVWDVLGWTGVASSVPVLDLPGGPAPGPVQWRSAGEEPAFEPGLRAFELERWVDVGLQLVLDPHTGGPAGSAMEAAACLGCHAIGFSLQEHHGVVSAVADVGDGSAAERGVGCEACHGRGSEHVAAGADEDGGVERILNPARLDPERALDVCGACHSAGVAVVSAEFGVDVAYPHAHHRGWRPGGVLSDFLEPAPIFWPGGAAAGPNEQVDELRASPHGGSGLYALGCGECHSAHGPVQGAPHQLAADPDDNGLCLGCHTATHFPEAADVVAHTAHSGYDPAGRYASGRCIGCHMPPTASRSGRSAVTGGGDLASHVFAIQPPALSLAAFDDLGRTTLPLEAVPPNACLACHREAELLYGALGVDFRGPAGEPTARETYVPLTGVYDLLFGEGP